MASSLHGSEVLPKALMRGNVCVLSAPKCSCARFIRLNIGELQQCPETDPVHNPVRVLCSAYVMRPQQMMQLVTSTPS